MSSLFRRKKSKKAKEVPIRPSQPNTAKTPKNGITGGTGRAGGGGGGRGGGGGHGDEDNVKEVLHLFNRLEELVVDGDPRVQQALNQKPGEIIKFTSKIRSPFRYFSLSRFLCHASFRKGSSLRFLCLFS